LNFQPFFFKAEIKRRGEIIMAKVIWKPLKRGHPIFTKGFSTYTPRTSRNVQGATRKIPKWLLGRETLYSPKRKEDK
jgi:hypothetical protein